MASKERHSIDAARVSAEHVDDNYNTTMKEEGGVATDSFEIFKKNDAGVDFRTVTWPQATMIFVKRQSCEQHKLERESC
jgi:hypothetical protein